MTDNIQQTTEVLHNPLIDRVKLPGETFKLPSGGIFYTNGELDSSVHDGEIHVHPMTTIDEITIKSPDMLYSGQAIVEIFKRCIPQVKKPLDMFTHDIDFLLICLRKVSFGADLQISHTHTCEGAKEHSYLLPMDDFIRQTKRIDPTTVTSVYKVNLSNGQTIDLQPIRYKHYIELLQINENEELSPQRTKEIMFNTLLSVIVKVDEVDNRTQIMEWLDKLPPGWLKMITDRMNETADWGPSFEYDIKCRDCGEEIKITAPLNPVAFFI